MNARRTCTHNLLAGTVTGAGMLRVIRFLGPKIKQRRLCCGMFAQLGHFVRAALRRLLLFSLNPALGFVPLSLLPCLFLLSLSKC